MVIVACSRLRQGNLRSPPLQRCDVFRPGAGLKLDCVVSPQIYHLTVRPKRQLLSHKAYRNVADYISGLVFTYFSFDGPRCHVPCSQVAYTGLLQMFLSRRAVSLLVCDVAAFGPRDGSSTEKNQLKRDLVKLQELRVCDWLRSLSFRIPDSDVVVVATKCDLACGTAADLAGRMERAIRKWLQNWRGAQMTAARVEDGVSLTSCVATLTSAEEEGAALGTRQKTKKSMGACDWRKNMSDKSAPSLLDRIMYSGKGDLRGAAMVLPRSWDIALEVLEALGSGRQVQGFVLPTAQLRQLLFGTRDDFFPENTARCHSFEIPSAKSSRLRF